MTEQAKSEYLWRSRLRLLGWGTIAALLIAPAIAMQFTGEVHWSPGDFVVAALMLGSVGLAMELAVRAFPNTAYRAGVALALAAGFLTIWINLAVGIVGNENNPVNALFFIAPLAVIGGGIVGAFRPRALARAAALAALVQVGVMLFIWLTGRGFPIGVTVFFATLYLIAAALFRQAAQPGG
ncbi:hypothetical protein ABS767_14625 [Sphingomonas sp. ST-64]|uniref:Uncharacterized protein n=1 Tax=Sphingomonas plantiphila TaxID=3163295 RepID=A0ABW8YPG9_9SPHN